MIINDEEEVNEEEKESNYNGIVEEAFSHELKKAEPPTLIQYLRSLRNNEFRRDELNRLFGRGPLIRDPETNEAYTNPLKLIGDTLDSINDQVSLEKISPMLQFLPEDNTPDVLKDVAEYSLKDFQYDAMDFVGEKARESINTGIPNLDKILVGGAVLGTAFAVPDATDFILPGAADTIRTARKVDWNKLIDWTLDESNSLFNRLTNPNWRIAGVNNAPIDDLNKGNVFFSKANEGLGNTSKGFTKSIKNTTDEYKNIVKSGMKVMNMEDDVFDIYKYNQYSPKLSTLTDTISGKVNKTTGIRNTKVLTKRNWMEFFLTPESLRVSFEDLRKAGKVSANETWEGFLKKRNLTTKDIQAHHINPLYDSMHLFHGVKWGSDEYWDIVSTLLNRGAAAGIAQKGDTINNIVRTFGKSTLIETPHGIAHEFYRDIMKVFFNEKEIARIANPNGFTDELGKFWKPKEYRRYKTKQWAKIVNRSEEILLETHKAWKSLNPKTRMNFDELVATMSKYDNKGIITGIHEKYQVKDIQKLVKDVEYDDFIRKLEELDAAEETAWMQNLEKEFIMDIIENMSKRDLKRKWGKKYNLKQGGMKQLDLFLK